MRPPDGWNMVVTIRQGCFRRMLRELSRLGTARPTDFHNVLLLHAEDPTAALEILHARLESEPGVRECIGHVAPVAANFTFQSPEDLEERTRQTLEPWLPHLAGKTLLARPRLPSCGARRCGTGSGDPHALEADSRTFRPRGSGAHQTGSSAIAAEHVAPARPGGIPAQATAVSPAPRSRRRHVPLNQGRVACARTLPGDRRTREAAADEHPHRAPPPSSARLRA
jgi:hypothetical protein